MSNSSPLTDRERADLVAYLDGELHGPAAQAIEGRIAREPAVRAEADALRRAWECLDFLPLPGPSGQFTHRTLQRVTPVATCVAEAPRSRRRRGAALLATGWAAAVLVALAAGYGAARRAALLEPGEQDMIRDLRVLENKRLYDAAEDLDFVRELDAPELFGDESAGT